MARREFTLYTECPLCGHRYQLTVELLSLIETDGPSARTLSEMMLVLCHKDARAFSVRVHLSLGKGESVVRLSCLQRTAVGTPEAHGAS